MPEIRERNLARTVYDAYPGSDLLPIDPARDCRSLKALAGRVTRDNIGDGLFRFLVVEIVEGGEGNLDGAIRVVRRAREDVDAVLNALVQVRQEHEGRRRQQ
jgi:hypothetical protein